MIRETKVPAIPEVRDDNVSEVLQALKNVVQVREGSIGNPLDQNATLRDLVALNLASTNTASATGNIVGGIVTPTFPPPNDAYSPETDYTTPPAPLGLRASGGFSNVYLEWDGAPYRNHSYTEVWRGSTDTLGSAVMIGTTAASVYADPAQPNTTYYYWVRFVSRANVTGPYNQTSGTSATTAINVAAVLPSLIDSVTSSQLFGDLGARITATETGITQLQSVTATTASQVTTLSSVVGNNTASLQVQAKVARGLGGQYTVKIDNNGHVSGFGLASTVVNGKPTSAFIVRADRFAIAGPNDVIDPLGTTTPTNVPFVVLTAPTVIGGVTYPAGVWIKTAFIADATISSAKIASLTADKITTGTLTASIGINTGQIYGGVYPAYGYPPGHPFFGTGFFLGNFGGSYQFFVGSPSQNILWNGTSLTVNGNGIINGNALITGTLNGDRIIANTVSVETLKQGSTASQNGYIFGFGNGSVYQGIDFTGYFETTNLGTAPLGAFGANNIAFAASTQWPLAAATFGNTYNSGGNFSNSGSNNTAVSLALSSYAIWAQVRTTGGSANQINADANTKAWAKIAFREGTDQSTGNPLYYGGQFYHTASGNYAALGTPSHGVYATSVTPFTGSHDGLMDKGSQPEPGDILVDVEIVAKKNVSDTITRLEASSAPNQRGAVGVFVQRTVETPISLTTAVDVERTNHEGKKTVAKELVLDTQYEGVLLANDIVKINSVGEGQINVCGEGGNLQIGDLIVTSSMPGKGMKQADDIIRGYTVAKCRENVTFSGPTDVKLVACIYLCG